MAGERDVIRLPGVTKRFDDVVAVDDVDLTVREGEFFSLLGPSGCGKTTTLRMIAGLETPTEGGIELFGTDVTDVPPQQRETNLVFQNLALFPHMTVEENIRFGLRHEGLSEAETAERIETMLDVVDMPGYGDRSVTDLSGGQQQRIALARSLAKQPAVLLLDEPLASLDRKLRQRMQFELKSIQEELGTTFFYVTHDQEVAMTMSDRMAVMRDGEIVQVGPPEEIYEEPVDAFVADFIGDANFVEGRVVEGDGGPRFERDGMSIPLDERPAGDSRLVLRPENVTIGEAAAETEFQFQCRVVDRVHQGSTINFVVELDDGTRFDVRQKERSVREGDETTVGFDRTDCALVEA
ncbi:MAG: ABC transporter ATP-binding protein [Haloferacaceae archaeon]